MKSDYMATLLVKSESVRDKLLMDGRDEALAAANYITFLRVQAKRGGKVEVSLLAGALSDGEAILAKVKK